MECYQLNILLKSLIQFIVLQLLVAPYVYCKESDFKYVTCGSILKLYNSRQGVRLHSHDIKYGSGSGQQSVTGSTQEDDHNSYWAVRGFHNSQCERGEKVKCDDIIRLQHMATKRNLHSHLFQSPISHNQEVSAFGDDGKGDRGDNWIVKCSGKFWNRKDKVRFQHLDTMKFLHASHETFGRPIAGQREIVGYQNEDAANQWLAQEGVYVKAK